MLEDKGNDVRINIKLSLEDLYSGVHKKIKYRKNNKCSVCNNTGGETSKCTPCEGQGVVNQIQNTPFGRIQNSVVCPKCQGSGEMIVKPCGSCGGNGAKMR